MWTGHASPVHGGGDCVNCSRRLPLRSGKPVRDHLRPLWGSDVTVQVTGEENHRVVRNEGHTTRRNVSRCPRMHHCFSSLCCFFRGSVNFDAASAREHQKILLLFSTTVVN